MNKEISIDIKSSTFPSQFVTDAEKKTEEFGLRVGQAIQYEWFRKDGQINRFYDRWREIHNLRLYARGEQSVAKYKNELAINGDLSYLNLDWTPVPVVPKFVDIVVNGMSDRLFTPKAYAQDALAQEERNSFQDNLEGQMVSKEMLMKIKETTGFNPFTVPPDELPESSEELELKMQLDYKPSIEIAEEEAIMTLLQENHYHELRYRWDYDVTVIGMAVGKHEFQLGAGVKISYVDPANVVYSYTEDPYFKDCFYWGEVKTIPITDVVKINPELTNSDLEEISKYSQAWYDYFNVAEFYQDSMFYRDTATLLYFNYKTTEKIVYKRKITESGAVRYIEKDETFDPPQEMMEEGRFEKVEKTIDVWYEGVIVMGTNILIKWDKMKNMVRPKSATQYALPNYVAVAPRMYKGVVESLVRRMIPFADLIQMTHLKLQQVIARTVPDGVYIDADGLNEVDLGNGGAYNPEEALRLYFQTGSVVGRSYTQDGEYNHGRVPIQELNHSSGSGKIQTLIFNYNHYLGMIRTVTGLNEARDGSDPDPRSLVGLQKMAALNSNTATRHILDASLFLIKRISEGLSYRIADILEYADFKDEFANKIGRNNVRVLTQIKNLSFRDFGIYIEVSPDEEQKAQLEQNIQIALNKQDINLEDAIDIREVKNVKLANQLLKIKRIKKQKKDEEREIAKQQRALEGNLQQQQAAAQAAMQKLQMETQSNIQIEQGKIAFQIEKMKAEAQLKRELMAEEFAYNMQIAQMQGKVITDRDMMKEKAKSDRISQQSTEQSQLIAQRKMDLPPMKFESNEDSLDGFDLAEFSPR